MNAKAKYNESISKNNRFSLTSVLFVFILVTGFLPGGKAFSIDFAVQKSVLLQKLDSLDMEKQIRKRKGQSIGDLEKFSTIIKDSIAGVKKELALIGGQAVAAPEPEIRGPAGMRLYFDDLRNYMPQNTFDWIVAVVGFIAIIAGGILCIGLFGMAWGKVFKKKKSTLKTMHEIFPETDEKNKTRLLSKSGDPDIENGDTKVDFLRRRIKEESAYEPFSGPGPGMAAPNISEEMSADVVGLKERVISAAEQGADISEISKRFHVGADHVSLILRVARQEKERNP